MLASVVAAVVGAAAAAVFGRLRFPRSPPVQQLMLVAFAALIGFTLAAVLLSNTGGSGPSLTVYSSLPRQDGDGGANKQTDDLEKAIRLALDEDGGKAGKFTIKYVPLDATDKAGRFVPLRIQDNARAAARDDKTAVYIGDVSSSASIESIPILSKAVVPQISPASTRVGLTVKDSLGDTNEPDQYYRGGVRNFVRIVPNDDVQAAALGALMKADRCSKRAIIYDGRDYSQGLSVLMSLIALPRRSFSEDVRPNERSRRYKRLARKARKDGVDCFLYIGDDNRNTFGIFKAFASEIPDATLYGTDGVGRSSLTDANGGLADFATRVRLMVPPRDLDRDKGFRKKFAKAYRDAIPDTNAIYGYEAMRLALDAISRSGSGTREDILEQLKSEEERDSVLGAYSIDGSGDTSLLDYDVATFEGGSSTLRRAVSRNALKTSLEVIRKRK